jgi:hypothetical protein
LLQYNDLADGGTGGTVTLIAVVVYSRIRRAST